MRFWGTLLKLSLLLVALSACTTTPPKNQENICAIFKEKRGWHKDAKRAVKRWGGSVPVLMAFIHQESRFDGEARPERKKILWIFPGPRKSDALGYAQAKKSTWRWYKSKSGHSGADRDDFDDAVDFVAWYNSMSRTQSGIHEHDAYNLYLAYHEGHGGFNRGTYKKKDWLIKVAKKVSWRAKMYHQQYAKCD